MSTTTMHFGPEWMRTKHQPLSRQQPPSPPPLPPHNGSASYSALVSATPPVAFGSNDESHPFRYSKEELLKIYQEGGGKGGLGLEVERWEGVVRESGIEPMTLREMTEGEKKLFSGPLNSEVRRRPSQSTEYLFPLNTSGLDRPRLNHSASSTSANSPMRERFGVLKRRDSAANSTDPSMLTLPRKPSLTTLQTPVLSPREAARTRSGYTPSFDGVLNNGESWVSRRRASEANTKAGIGPSKDGLDNTQDVKASGIQEEKEENPVANPTTISSSHQTLEQSYGVSASISDTSRNSKLANGISDSDPFGANHPGIGPPPGLVDLAAVEWSYKDPSGQVQGPFRADLMQKWYNDGYFSIDLPMKRVGPDTQWITVGELVQRSNGDNNIFLTPNHNFTSFNHDLPPVSQVYAQSEQVYNEPHQPAPMRSIRNPSFDTYLNAGSDSPSSSATSHFGNPSPDSSAFNGWDNRQYYSADPNGRLVGFGMLERPSPLSDRRIIGHEFQTHSNATYTSFTPERNLGFAGYVHTNDLSDAPQMQQRHSEIGNTIPLSRPFNQGLQQLGEQLSFNGSQMTSTDVNASNYLHHHNFSDQQSFQNSPIQQQQFALPIRAEQHVPTGLYSFRDPNDDIVSSQSPRSSASHAANVATVPWGGIPDTSAAQSVEQQDVSQEAPVAWNRDGDGPGPLVQNDNDEPLQKSTVDQEAYWNEERGDHVVPQQNQQPEPSIIADASQQPTVDPLADLPSTTSASNLHASQPLSKKGSQVTPTSNVQPSSTQPTPAPVVSMELSPSVTIPKMAWVKEDENRKKVVSNASAVSLREIQEAEARKLETRKAAERERERAARAAAAASDAKDDLQSFTASWGLPTSQAGNRGANTLPRDVPVPPTQSPVTPVWTTSVKPIAGKKTMKEIQEEEGRKKIVGTKEPFHPSLPKRPYTDIPTKVVGTSPPSATSNTSNVWTTVGPSGKATPVALRPNQTSIVTTTPGPKQPAQPIQRAAAAAPPKQKTVTVKQDETPETPSHDFLKWLSDSLKGLNASVNVEEIVSMLLSFPMDPDAITIEIISDTIYSNSTTLDGRRFASEFVSKRKSDAIARAKGATSGKTPTKPISIADVVKATPKPAQAEWGFKVVNKKKKGGRS